VVGLMRKRIIHLNLDTIDSVGLGIFEIEKAKKEIV
jgi:hypothetical protein